ncbi:exocyst complex component EXO70H1-like [Curcuma longa]|uniref:exocyst complex component EXO70H1-like n=1 Tax=Curcuma longa TaxID=136217 RepID=UPI003D9F98D6
MTRTGLRGLFPSYSFGLRGGSPASSPRPAPQQRQMKRLSDAMMEDHVVAVEAAIAKWESDAVLFSDERRAEARAFLADVSSLQHSMLLLVSGTGAEGSSSSSSHAALVSAQSVMQAAMSRLEKEFHRILTDNHHSFYPKAVSVRSSSRSNASEDREGDSGGGAEDSAGEFKHTAASSMADLQAIAETMVSAGYSNECVKVYKLLRKSVVDEGLRRLEFDQIGPNSQVHKLDWASLEIKIRSWLLAASAAVSSLFSGERILLDHVFAGHDSIRESIFGDISGDAAAQFLRFPEAVAKSKRSMEKMTRLLDLYDIVSELLPEVDSVFSFESTAPVRDQVLASLSKLGEAIRATIADFEAALQTKHLTSLFPGCGVHPLTRRTMKYIAVIADYETTLTKIFDGSHTAVPLSPSIGEHGERSEVARLLSWLMLELLCKLDAKAATYRDAALSHLFLANNFQCVANRAQACSLRGVLREEWAVRHDAKARHHAERYEQAAWRKVAEAVPAREVSPEEARERMRLFSAEMEAACASQAGWVVADTGMREEVRDAVRGMVLPAYRSFYDRWRATPAVASVARFSPKEVGLRIAELFAGSDHGPGPDSNSGYRIEHDTDSSRLRSSRSM